MPDVLVVGGAANGWATAHHLLRIDPSLGVTVLERDPTLRYSSTMLSDGNVRIQFNLEENIRISQYAMEILETFADTMAIGDFRPDPLMRKQGNLFLVDEAGEAAARAGLATQQALGCDSVWLDMAEITRRHPALHSDDLVGGTFGPSDGSVDPHAVVEGYRRNAISAGAVAEQGEAVSLVVSGDRVTGVRTADDRVISADVVVVAAGAWTAGLVSTAGVEIPVDPVMRTVYVVTAQVDGGDSLPSFFLPSGVYVLPEHDNTFFMAWSTDEDPVGFDFTPAPRSRFYDSIWPELATTLPAFDRLEVIRSWAGLYAQNRLDANAIVGEWPERPGLFLATGFSGHGFQQCHAVGRHLAELVLGRETSLDLRRLGPERIIAGEPLYEHAGRII
ncbi:MAG TPA: FAD-binding oxidoreductase [Acidimicrobiia bacterium]|nr:FAD-binding oxidoreductase [Acidimicrobiia bacterium]